MKINFTKIIAMAAVGVMTVFAADAATFTAIASGNWSSSTTWQDGNVPGNNITSDDVVIGSGITVNLDQDVEFGGILLVSGRLDVDGVLTSTTSGRSLLFTGGARLEGDGKIDLSKVRFQLATTLAFTGEILADELENTASLITASRIFIREMARLTGGLTISDNGRFEASNNSWIIVNGGSLTATGTGSIVLTGEYSVWYQGAGTTSGAELKGSGLKRLFIDIGAANSLTLNDNITINDSLYIISGILNLNERNITLKGNYASGTTGMINSSDKSDITFEGIGYSTGDVKFTATGNKINNLTINRTSEGSFVKFGSDAKIYGVLNLMSGSLHTGDYAVEILGSGSIQNSSDERYVITGAQGKLGMVVTENTNWVTYPVGTEVRYLPAKVNSITGTGMVWINTMNEVYAQGTTGADLTETEKMVKGTWNITSDITANLNFDLMVMWHASSEVNSFDRSKAYISHYMAGQWDVKTSTAATEQGDSMYGLIRSNVTALSPFSVRQGNSTGIADINALSGATVYPNPANDYIVINNVEKANIEVMNELGQVVLRTELNGSTPLNTSELKTGNYFIRISSAEASTVKKFVKL